MKTIHTLLSLVALALSGTALAGGGVYPVDEQDATASGKSRAEVIAEWQEAQRLGLMTISEAGLPESTPRQEAQIAAAGRRAAEEERHATTPAPAATADAPQPTYARRETGRRIMRM